MSGFSPPNAYYKRPMALVLGACLLVGTSGQACKRSENPVLSKDDEVVARVNGTPITRYDVEHTGRRSLGSLAVPEVRRTAYPKLLEATVQSRAIALAMEKELSEEEAAALEKELQAHRERLLVQRYVDKHAPPKPVTAAMISDYYKNHPERFGGGTERSYELLGTSRPLTAAERISALEKLKQAASASDWNAQAQSLIDQGVPITYSSATDSDKILHAKLREHLAGIEAGKQPDVVFVQGRAFVARVVGEVTRPPKPLAEVRQDIERLLKPAQLSSALRQISAKVIEQSKIEILKPKNVAPAAEPSGEKTQ